MSEDTAVPEVVWGAAHCIRCHLDQVLLSREVTLTKLSERTGTTLANLSILKTNKARAVRFLDRDLRRARFNPAELSTLDGEHEGDGGHGTAA